MAQSSIPGSRPVQFIFLSGSAQPLTIQPGDRRFWLVEEAQVLELQDTSDVSSQAGIRQKLADWLSRPLALHGDAVVERAEQHASQPTVHPSRTAPLCCDCKFQEFVGDSYMRFSMCGHPSMARDLEIGTAEVRCSSARNQGRNCGPSGALFQRAERVDGRADVA